MSTRRALAFSFLDRYAGLIVHMGTVMVVARLLTPAEIGVYSVAMVMIGFIATFRDLGAGQYLIQKQHLVPADLQAVWAVQLGLGLAFAIGIAAVSGPVATFYREPRIKGIMLLVALNFAITPFAAFHYAWMMREMRFGALALIRGSSAIGNAVVVIALAWSGYGAISLAWANVTATFVSIGVIFFTSDVNIPWARRIAGIRKVISFGGKLTVIATLDSAREAAPDLFLGRLQGMTATGLYSRGQGLVAMFDKLVTDAAGSVAMPYFAKRIRDGEGMAKPFLHVLALITALGWSFAGCLAILAFPTIRVLYGNQWDDAVDPTRWLAAAMMFSVPNSVCLAPLLASGALSNLAWVVMLTTCVWVALAGAGAHFGLLTMTQLLVLGAAVSAAPLFALTKRHVGFRWAALFQTLGRSAIVTIATILVPLAVTLSLGWRSPSIVLMLTIAIPGSALGFLIAVFLLRHPISDELARILKPPRA